MTASLWLVAGLACAEVAPPAQPAPANTAQDARVQGQAESVPVASARRKVRSRP